MPFIIESPTIPIVDLVYNILQKQKKEILIYSILGKKMFISLENPVNFQQTIAGSAVLLEMFFSFSAY